MMRLAGLEFLSCRIWPDNATRASSLVILILSNTRKLNALSDLVQCLLRSEWGCSRARCIWIANGVQCLRPPDDSQAYIRSHQTFSLPRSHRSVPCILQAFRSWGSPHLPGFAFWVCWPQTAGRWTLPLLNGPTSSQWQLNKMKSWRMRTYKTSRFLLFRKTQELFSLTIHHLCLQEAVSPTFTVYL